MEIGLDDEFEDEELSAGLCTAVVEGTGAETEGVVFSVTGATKSVGTARLTVAPGREVTGTGDGIEGAVEEFIAESSQAFIHPW